MRKEHLDLFSELPGNLVLSCFADGASNITGIFVFFTSDGTEVHVRAALRFGWKSLTRILQRAVLGDAFACRTAIGIRVVATELLQRLAFWTDVLVVLGIPIKVDTGPSAIPAASLINDWDVGRDLTVYQPTEHRARVIGSVRDQPLRMQIELTRMTLFARSVFRSPITG